MNRWYGEQQTGSYGDCGEKGGWDGGLNFSMCWYSVRGKGHVSGELCWGPVTFSTEVTVWGVVVRSCDVWQGVCEINIGHISMWRVTCVGRNAEQRVQGTHGWGGI